MDTVTERPPYPYFRPVPLPDPYLTVEELTQILRPLRRDYCRQIVATAHLPNNERQGPLVARLEAYSAALAATLTGAHEDAEALVRRGRR